MMPSSPFGEGFLGNCEANFLPVLRGMFSGGLFLSLNGRGGDCCFELLFRPEVVFGGAVEAVAVAEQHALHNAAGVVLGAEMADAVRRVAASGVIGHAVFPVPVGLCGIVASANIDLGLDVAIAGK